MAENIMEKRDRVAYNKQWYADNKKHKKQYYIDNREKVLARRKQHYADNTEETNAWNKQYYIDNKEKIRESHKQYYSDNKEKRRRYTQKRRVKKLNAFVETVSINILFERDCGCCRICNRKLNLATKHPDPMFASIDHIVPLSKCGEHSYKNTQLACLECNLRKGVGTYEPKSLQQRS